jgi:HTH-type transcriptional regulator / antitoxin HigA
MSEIMRNQYLPDSVSAPGETLLEVIEGREMSQAELAERTGRPIKTINEIIKGKAGITPETALQLERVLDIPAAFWISREQQYRESLARIKETQSLAEHIDWLQKIPCAEMMRMGWITRTNDKLQQIREVLRFFGVASPAIWDEIWGNSPVAFRQSSAFRTEPGAVAAWLRKGELQAQEVLSDEYDPTRFKDVLRHIRTMTRELPLDFASIVVRECSNAGVRVVFVPELPGTCAWGATRWLSQTSALMQLSLRYKTDDHLWFTFFHEAAHILLHGKRDLFLEAEDLTKKDEKEAEADSFAREWLIPEVAYRKFKRRGANSCDEISRFAFELNISAGIVVGRMQHDGLLPRTNCNHLKRKIGWERK